MRRIVSKMGSDRQPRVDELCSAAAAAALAEWSRSPHAATDRLGLAEFLRARFEPALARALALQFELRLRAGAKFDHPGRVLLRRKELEQATRLDVARWRARRVKDFAPESPVVDATCGLGADALALIGEGLLGLGIENDPLTAQFAAHNLREMSGRNCVVLGTALSPPVLAQYWLVDPDRRSEQGRSLDPTSWSPPLATALALARAGRGACIKLPPAFELGDLGLQGAEHWRWLPAWVSAGGELRECSLWCGAWAAGTAPGEREAVLLDAGHSLRAVPVAVAAWEPEEALAVRWLADPDPALVRSGLLGNVALRAGARPLAARIAYLGSREPIADPLLSPRRVLDACPLDVKRVRRMLAAHDIGSVEIMKRGHPEPAEVLARKLAGTGSQRGSLAVARLERGHAAYLLEPR